MSALQMIVRPVQADLVSKKLRGKDASETRAHRVAMLSPCPDCSAKPGEMCAIPNGIHEARYHTTEAKLEAARRGLKNAQRRAKLALTIAKKWQRRVKRLERKLA